MSVYRDTTGSVVFKHPISATATQLTATVTDSTGTQVDAQTVVLANSVYTYNVPWSLTQYDSEYSIAWTDGNGFSRKQNFDVVTPIVSLDI